MEAGIKIIVCISLTTAQKQYLLKRLAGRAEVFFCDELPGEKLQDIFLSSDIVLGNPPADWLESGTYRLQWMQLESAGFDAYRRLPLRFPVTNLHGYFAQPCAETVVAGIMALYRKTGELALLKEKQQWVGDGMRGTMQLLHGKKVILLGTGTIAAAIKNILDAFACSTDFYGRDRSKAAFQDKETLIAALQHTDILINTLPATAETVAFVDGSILKALKSDAVFVNIGRGSTVDEAALVSILQQRKIGGAVLDVYSNEPLPPGDPLWTCPNTILTQHTGGGSAGEITGKIDFFMDNFDLFMAGKPLKNIVNLEKGY